MTGIRDVLVIVDLGGPRPSLAAAADIASSLGAHLTGVSPIFETIVPSFGMAPVPPELIVTMRDAAETESRAATAVFEEAARKAGVPFRAVTPQVIGGGFTGILRHCRLTDLVVIGQDDEERPEPMRRPLIEAVLLESGVPVLVVPNIMKGTPKFDHALVGWDGSATAAAAVHAALPLLAKAKTVDVLIVDTGGELTAETGYDIGDYLARHDMKVEVSRLASGGIPVADTLLNFVSDKSIDFVVMGAYGHSRVREFIFGGATRDILSEMTVPVVLAR